MSERSIDFELVKRVKKGDKHAFDLLVRKYQHKVASLISRYVQNPTDAQDVAQEAFIKAYRGLKNFRGESAFYTWMYRIAVNTAKNHLVGGNRRTTDSAFDIDEPDQPTLPALQDIGTPERQLLSAEIKDVITQTIDGLPDELRTAISLREFEGMGYEEIAVAMECPIGTVRSRIFRAREAVESKLRPLLDETGVSDERQQ